MQYQITAIVSVLLLLAVDAAKCHILVDFCACVQRGVGFQCLRPSRGGKRYIIFFSGNEGCCAMLYFVWLSSMADWHFY